MHTSYTAYSHSNQLPSSPFLMSISRLSERISGEPVSLSILLLRDAPEHDIRAPFYPIPIAQILKTLLDISEQFVKHHLLSKHIPPTICAQATDDVRKHPLDIRRVRLDNTPPRLEVAGDDFGLNSAQSLPQSFDFSPGFCLRKSSIQESARVVGRFGAKVDAPGCSRPADPRVSTGTPNGQDEAVDIHLYLVALGVLLLDLLDASGGIVDEELVVWDAAMKGFVRRVEVAAGNPEVATSTSITGVWRHCLAA